MKQRRHSSQRARGFTLVEVLVSLTLLSVASLAMGSMLFRVTRQAGAASAGAHQTAMVSGEVSRLGATPFDLLGSGTTCVTVTYPFPGTRCTTINNVSPKVKEVTVVVTPSGNPLLQPISSTFTRTISGTGTPLKTQ
jgi:prepilin-type N-terminal cleavage/methylation domain-containing protein